MKTNYWQTRNLKERERLLDAYINTTEKLLRSRYKSTSKRIIEELEKMYLKIMEEGEEVLISHLYSYNRYWEILSQINEQLNTLGEYEDKLLSSKLLNLYEKNYELLGKQYNFYGHVDIEKAKRTVSTAWVQDGVNFSSRIWKHKGQLMNALQQGIVDCVQAGMSADEFTKLLMNKFSVSFNQASKLARTELSHIYNQSAVDRYKDSDITEYEWLTAPDCCDECEEMNGRRFSIEDIDDVPPLHPFCRCTIIPIISK